MGNRAVRKDSRSRFGGHGNSTVPRPGDSEFEASRGCSSGLVSRDEVGGIINPTWSTSCTYTCAKSAEHAERRIGLSVRPSAISIVSTATLAISRVPWFNSVHFRMLLSFAFHTKNGDALLFLEALRSVGKGCSCPCSLLESWLEDRHVERCSLIDGLTSPLAGVKGIDVGVTMNAFELCLVVFVRGVSPRPIRY